MKTGYKQVDRKFRFVDRDMGNRQDEVKVHSKVLKSNDLNSGQFAFTKVKKESESPGSPTSDEGRLYFKDKEGVLWKFTGEKV